MLTLLVFSHWIVRLRAQCAPLEDAFAPAAVSMRWIGLIKSARQIAAPMPVAAHTPNNDGSENDSYKPAIRPPT